MKKKNHTFSTAALVSRTTVKVDMVFQKLEKWLFVCKEVESRDRTEQNQQHRSRQEQQQATDRSSNRSSNSNSKADASNGKQTSIELRVKAWQKY